MTDDKKTLEATSDISKEAGAATDEITSETPVEASVATGDAVTDHLAGLGVDTDVIAKIKELGAESVEDLTGLTEADLTGAGMLLLKARKLAAALAPAPAAAIDPMAAMTNFNVLPDLPDDSSWLKGLKVGGVLKFNRDTVIGTVSAALADRVGLYGLPDKIVTAMEKNAESLEEPVGAEFFEMQRTLTQRSYSEIFAALPGATGKYASPARKKGLLAKMDDNLWKSLINFNSLISDYMDAWQKGMANPNAMLGAMSAMMSGGSMPPGMMAPPATDGLRDSAEGVITSINRIFAGTGIPVAMALAYDAQQIRKALENPNLPAQVGALNRDQMLKQLGVAVSSDYPRLESNLKQFTLGVIELPNVTAGQTEMAYITSLFQLGASIPWNQLGVGSNELPGIGQKL